MNAGRIGLLAVLGVYFVLGALYALNTPLWQIPDEPAHYNYIVQVSDDTIAPPVITASDYPFDYLERLKAERFAQHLSIEGISYEDHQPPLYYYAASGVYRATDGPLGSVHAIRLMGVLLGAVTVCLTFGTARLAVPDDWALPVAAAGIVAFLPMNLTMTAAVNNDPLAHLLIAMILYCSVRRATNLMTRTWFMAVGGSLFGLALLTKTTIYLPAVCALVAAEVALWRSGTVRGKSAAISLAGTMGVGAVIGSWWFVRNARQYGLTDPLGLGAHDAAVVGQPRTGEFVAANGAAQYLRRLLVFTFDSFWGVFGWMGVFLDTRIYVVLALATAGAIVGFVGYLWPMRAVGHEERWRRVAGLAPLAAVLAAALLAFLGYNLSYVQHQGRYLFPALLAIAIFFTLGLRQVACWFSSALSIVAPELGPTFARPLELLAMFGFSTALAVIAILSLYRYVIPGLT